MIPLLMALAPTIAQALINPVTVGAAVEFVADKLGVTDKTKEGIQNAVSGMSADQLVKFKEMDLEFQKFMAENNIKIDLAQIENNQLDAKSEHWVQYGWRPFVGWVGGVGFAYASIFEPFMRFVAKVCFSYTGGFPAIDTMLTLQVLGGLLGLAGLRSWDKKNNKVGG